MTRPTRFVLRMAAFILVVLAVAVVLWPTIERAFLANPALNGLIVFVLVFGIGHSLLRVLMLNREITWMEGFRRRRALPVELPQPKLLQTIAQAMGSSRDGMVRMSAMTMRSLLDSVDGRLDEQGAIARYLVGLLIFLGLLGTFWGLLETVASVGSVIGGLNVGGGESAVVFEELKSGLSAPLAGMGTAFASSLFGLAGALVLGFLDLQAGQAQNRFLNELEEWISTHVRLTMPGFAAEGDSGGGSVPAYIQALLEQTAETMEDLRRIVGRAEEGRLAASQGVQALSERMTTLTNQMQTEQQLMVRLAEQQMELAPVLSRLADRMTGRVELDPGSLSHLTNIDRNLGGLTQELVNGRAELMRDLRGEIKLLARTLSGIEQQAGERRQGAGSTGSTTAQPTGSPRDPRDPRGG